MDERDDGPTSCYRVEPIHPKGVKLVEYVASFRDGAWRFFSPETGHTALFDKGRDLFPDSLKSTPELAAKAYNQECFDRLTTLNIKMVEAKSRFQESIKYIDSIVVKPRG